MSNQVEMNENESNEEEEQKHIPMWASYLAIITFMISTVIAILTWLGPQIGNVFSRQLAGLQ